MGLSGEATAGIVLGLIGLVAIVCLTLYTHRRLRTSTSTGEVTDLDDRLPNAPISSSHPASRIIPFGPKFVHKPGSDMRIATLGTNGVWEFTPTPSPLPTPPLDPFAKSSKKSSAYQWDTDSTMELEPPPPAYYREP